MVHMQLHHKRHVTRLVRYVSVSSATFLADISIVHAGTLLGFPVSFIGPVGFLSMAVVSYFLMHHWVFHDHTSTHSRASVLYALLVLFQASCIGFGLQYLMNHTHLAPELARVAVGTLSGTIGFLACHFVIFVKK